MRMIRESMSFALNIFLFVVGALIALFGWSFSGVFTTIAAGFGKVKLFGLSIIKYSFKFDL